MVVSEAIKATVEAFFSSIEGLDHRVASVWTSGQQTIIKGRAVYALSSGETVDIPMMVTVRLNSEGDRIEEARVFIDPAPLTNPSGQTRSL